MKEGPHFGLVLDLYLIPKKWFYGDLYSKTLINDKLLFEHEVGMLKRDHNFASMETIEQIIGNNNQVHCEKDKSSLISRNSL